MMPDHESGRKVHKAIEFELKIATYNVMTAQDHEAEKVTDVGRVALLRDQFMKGEYHIVGLQETCNRAGMIVSSTHVRFCSGANERGHLGVEIWLSLDVPMARDDKGRQYYFSATDFVVLHSDPRILVVHCRNKILECVVVCAHSPHSGAPLETRQQWWESLQQISLNASSKLDQILLIDANARVHTPIDGIIGELIECFPTPNEERFVDLLGANGLFLPCTFAEFQWGDIATWIHPSGGSASRLDYIAIPVHWRQSVVSTWVDWDITSGVAAIDHACSSAFLRWTQIIQSHRQHSRSYDKAAMNHPEAKTTLRQIVDGIPVIPWEVNASVHAAKITRYLRNALCQAFPRQRKVRQNEVASAKARDLCTLTTSLRRQLKPYKLMTRLARLHDCFNAWKNNSADTRVSSQWTRQFFAKQALIRHNLNQAAWKLRKQLQADRRGYLDNICTQVCGAKPGEVFRMLRPLIGTSRRHGVGTPLPQIHKADGTAAASFEEYQQRWTEHFAQLEGGHITDPNLFVRQELDRQRKLPVMQWQTVADMPSLSHLETALRKVNLHKAVGPDQVPGDLLHMFPREFARILFPLLVKFAVRLHEPIQWKGGQLIKLYKGKGPIRECASFRGILLMSTIGKAIRAGMRHKVNRAFAENSTDTHFGGKPAQSVIFGAQMVRHFISTHKNAGTCCAILFCDIASAFYRVLRQLATGASVSDEEIAIIVARLGLAPEVMHKLHQALNGQSAHEQLLGTQPERRLLQESLNGTWFWTEKGPFVHTLVGTRPGDSWADITFNILFAEVINEVQKELINLGLALTVPANAKRCFEAMDPTAHDSQDTACHATWADDLALLLPLRSPEEAVAQTGRAAQALLMQLARVGLKASFGTSKTAALLFIRGKDAVAVRRKIFATKSPQIPVILEEETVLIPIVTQYKHLGGIVAAKANMRLEISARIGKANAAFVRISQKVLRSRHYPLNLRLQIFEATVMSIFQWGCGAWPILQEGEWKNWLTACYRMFRKLSPLSSDMQVRHVSNAEILVSLAIPTPLDRLQTARVRHIGSMIKSAPNAVWALLRQDAQARRAYEQALKWLWQGIGRDKGAPPPYDWEAWEKLAVEQPLTWKRLIKKVSGRYKNYRVTQARVRQAYADILKVITEAGGAIGGRSTQTQHYCLLCDQPFCNKRAWFLHAHYKHSYISMAGQAATGTSCPVCAKEYFSKEKLKHHLQYSAACRHYAWRHNEGASSQERVHDQMPWIYTNQPAIRHDDREHRDDVQLWENLQEAVANFTLSVEDEGFAEDVYCRIREACNMPMPFPNLVAVFERWSNNIGPNADPALLQAGQRIRREFSDICLRYVTFDDWNLDNENERKAIQLSTIKPCRPSRSFREKYFLHLYSGRRRKGDLQDALEALEPEAGVTLWVLSVDVMVSGQYCDLLQHETQLLWLRIAREGLVEGLLAGPPCETWSVAREADGMAPERGPRPLRTAIEPWGLIDLSQRESLQIDAGNQLMIFAIRICLTQALQGKFSLLEHPDDPGLHDSSKAASPTIWRTAVLDWLRQLDLFFEMRLEQGYYGQVSRKPTRFLISGVMPSTARQIELHCRTSKRPTSSTIGKSGGSFKTAKLKEYTAELCAMIAQLYAHRLRPQCEAWMRLPMSMCG